MNLFRFLSFLICFIIVKTNFAAEQKQITIESPDGKTIANVYIGQRLSYDVYQDGMKVLDNSTLSLTLTDGTIWGISPKLKSEKRDDVNQVINTPFYKQSTIKNCYNSVNLTFDGQWGVEFRVFDDGVAYRFISTKTGDYNIKNEFVEYCFVDDAIASVPYVKRYDGKTDLNSQFHNSFENVYTVSPISELDKSKLMFLPLVVDAPSGKRLSISESDLRNYPGMYLSAPIQPNKLEGVFAPYPAEVEEHVGHNNLQVTVKEREDYIAKISGARTFPWRAVTVGRDDIELANSNMSYLLAEPSKIEDTSWIKPGKVAWDWWNDWNLKGVNFRAGINNETYKYYIDFASKNKIEYVILDEGWAVNKKYDLMQVVPEIDIQELVDYGEQRGVGIILWAGYYAFDRDMENVCAHYSKMGVKGFKVDFMDRDDQILVHFTERAAIMAAKYELILDMHGTYKPAGINRTYPNILNFEGVFGLEQMKWSDKDTDQVTYDVMVPFIRMTSGPMDYTQGAMKNAIKGNYNPVYNDPMSQGTRSHQVAQYIIFLAPLNMMCDTPTNYEDNKSTTEFISSIPTVWDESRTVDGKIGEYIVTVRRKGKDWYIGGLNNWTARDIALDISELTGVESGQIEIYKDGINADRNGQDFVLETISLDNNPLTIHMAPGGGFTIKIISK